MEHLITEWGGPIGSFPVWKGIAAWAGNIQQEPRSDSTEAVVLKRSTYPST